MARILRLGLPVAAIVALLIWEPFMAFGKEIVLASDFSGRLVTADGSPAAGIRLTRSLDWAWGKEVVTDETTTGPDGRFGFPKVVRRSLTAGLLPHQPSIQQEITAHGPAGAVLIWAADKPNYEDGGEMGKPIRVLCRLDREPSADGLFWGTCTEDN